MIYRTTSSKVVLARIKKYMVESGYVSDAIMHIGDAIQKLGILHSTSIKATSECELIQVKNHIAELPCDLETIERVEYKGYRMCYNFDISINGLSSDDYKWGKYPSEYYYYLNYGNFKTSLEEGEIKLFYRSFNVDPDGFVIIPDEPNYRDAILFYVLGRLLLEGYNPKLANLTFEYCEQKHEQYASKAKARIKGLSRDRREAISRMWTSLNTTFIPQTQLDRE